MTTRSHQAAVTAAATPAPPSLHAVAAASGDEMRWQRLHGTRKLLPLGQFRFRPFPVWARRRAKPRRPKSTESDGRVLVGVTERNRAPERAGRGNH
jgi:hypothetical protein